MQAETKLHLKSSITLDYVSQKRQTRYMFSTNSNLDLRSLHAVLYSLLYVIIKRHTYRCINDIFHLTKLL